MTKLHHLFDEQGQSPWLDNLTRNYLRDGSLARFVAEGIRGVTATRPSSPRPSKALMPTTSNSKHSSPMDARSTTLTGTW